MSESDTGVDRYMLGLAIAVPSLGGALIAYKYSGLTAALVVGGPAYMFAVYTLIDLPDALRAVGRHAWRHDIRPLFEGAGVLPRGDES